MYFTANGHSQYERPTLPAADMPATGSLKRKHFREMIDNIMESRRSETPRDKTSTPGTPQPPKSESKKESWRSYSEEKQKKIYENTVGSIVFAGDSQPSNYRRTDTSPRQVCGGQIQEEIAQGRFEAIRERGMGFTTHQDLLICL
jgi:hypothetical protein